MKSITGIVWHFQCAQGRCTIATSHHLDFTGIRTLKADLSSVYYQQSTDHFSGAGRAIGQVHTIQVEKWRC